MGSVYRARDLHFSNVVRLVAVKEMVNMARDPGVRQTIIQNFEREANILVTLNHPSIPRIFDFFTNDDRSYLVMEFINGKNLEAILRSMDTFFNEDQIIKWGIELCDVLAFLHNHKSDPIIFRDMKPSNIMLNQYNQVVLVDFGIAKIFRVGQKGTMIGTEGYSPPEQYRGESTPLADIYALGATLHHLATRRDPSLETPFTFKDRPIRSCNPSSSPELELVIDKAVQYNPEDRFQKAEEMREALIVAGRKTGALSQLIDLTTISPVQTQIIKPLWTFECEDEIRGSVNVDGGVAYVGAYDNNLYALNASDGNFIWKYPTDGGIVGKPAISDGVIYIGSEDKRLHAISQRSGKMLWAYYTDGPVRSSPRVAEGHIFVGSDDHFLHAVKVISTRVAWRVEAADAIRSTPFIAGDLVYFGCESGDLYCVDFRGEIKWRFKSKRPITSSPIVSQGTVYCTSLDGFIYALDAKSGWVLWRFRMGKGSISSPLKVENLIIAGSADNNIYCVEAGSAHEVWRYQAGFQVSGSPVIFKDSLFCGSAEGAMYCLEYHSGRLRWKFSTGGPITGTPVVNNDILYFGSSDHFIYALMV